MKWQIALSEQFNHVDASAGTVMVVRGQWNNPQFDLSIDACSDGPSAGPSQVGVGHGAFDYRSGGWQLQHHDAATHTCRFIATTNHGVGCTDNGLCLPSRIQSIANSRLQTVSEFSEHLVGGIEAEVLSTAQASQYVPPPPPSWMEKHGTKLALGTVSFAVIAALMVAWFRKRSRLAQQPEFIAQRLAHQLSARLQRADAMYQQLAPTVRSLASQAQQLAQVREKLLQRLSRINRQELQVRCENLRNRPEQSSETKDTIRLLSEQLSIADQWQEQSTRTNDKLERLIEYLRTLQSRLDNALDLGAQSTTTGVRVADDTKVLKELEEDVQSTLAAAYEADRLVA